MRALLAGLMGIVTFLSLIAYAFGEDKPKAPTIPDAMQKQFFKAYAEALQASSQAQQANDAAKRKSEALGSISDKLKAFCGDAWQIGTNPAGDLECQPLSKKAETKPAEKK